MNKELWILRNFDRSKIEYEPIKPQIKYLIDYVIEEMEMPPRRVRGGSLLAAVFGIISGYIYIQPTWRLTKNDSLAYSYFAITSTTLSNVIVNIYFNLDAVLRLASLRDPLTKRLTVSIESLIFNSAVSLASAFAFAFLGLGKEPTYLDYSIFFILLLTYASQHFFSVMDLTARVSDLPCLSSNNESKLIKQILKNKTDQAFAELMAGLEEDKPDFLAAFYEEEKLSAEKLTDLIFSQRNRNSDSSKPFASGLTKIAYSSTQVLCFFSQVIGGMGYWNSAINGFKDSLPISLCLAWVLATASMTPVYLLAFILSYQNVAKTADLLANIISNIWQGRSRDILKEFPYIVRKAPIFSFITGSVLTFMSAFSFFTAISLFIEAVYGDNSDNPAQFTWIDSDEQAKSFYTELTRFATIWFNIFPVPEVLSFLAQKFCLLTGSAEDKQAIKVMTVMESLQRRISGIPVDAFSNGDDDFQPRRKNPCSRLMNWLCSGCGFWNQKSSLLLNGGDDDSLNSSLKSLI